MFEFNVVFTPVMCFHMLRHMATINKCQLHARSLAAGSTERDQQTAFGHEIKYDGELFVVVVYCCCLLLLLYSFIYINQLDAVETCCGKKGQTTKYCRNE